MFNFALPALAVANTFMSPDAKMNFMNMAMDIIIAGVDAKAKMEALNAKVQEFVDEERDPSDEEWESLSKRSDDAHEGIQNS